MAGLTPKEEEFCRLVVCERLKKPDAYRRAFGRADMSGVAASKAASEVSKKPEVFEFCHELRERATSESVMALTARKEELSGMAREAREAGDIRAAVACIAELNKMEQVYTTQPAVNVAVGVQVVATFDELMHELEGGGAMSRSIQ